MDLAYLDYIATVSLNPSMSIILALLSYLEVVAIDLLNTELTQKRYSKP